MGPVVMRVRVVTEPRMPAVVRCIDLGEVLVVAPSNVADERTTAETSVISAELSKSVRMPLTAA
jgi:hypothetical protein